MTLICATVAHLAILVSVGGTATVPGADSDTPPPIAATQAPSSPTAPRTASEAEYDRGASLAAAGKFKEARATFEAAAKADPGNGSLAAALAILQDADKGRVAIEVVQRIFRATQHATDGRWTDAHAEADAALRRAPQYPRAHAAKASLYVSQGQYAQAVKALDQAVALDPGFAEAYYNRGAVRAELQQIDAAIADYDRAIELQPSYWYAYRNRGSAHTHKRNSRAAIADYTKALELRPQDVETRLLRAVVNMAMRQWDAAMPDLSRVIELDPAHAPALYHRGLVYEQKGDVARAKADYAAAIKSDTTGEVAAAAKQRLETLAMRREN
jgi:tetratricopeptide (TPR) repeat protein